MSGIYHPCGAYNVTVAGSGSEGLYAPDGSYYVTEDITNLSGALRVNVVSGSLDPASDPILRSPINMTDNTTPAPFVASASAEGGGGLFAAFKPFDGDPAGFSFWTDGGGVSLPQWVKIDLGSSLPCVYYKVQARTPTFDSWVDWVLEGSDDDSSWTLADSHTGESVFSDGEIRTYTLSSPKTFRYWRWTISVGARGTDDAEVAGLEIWG